MQQQHLCWCSSVLHFLKVILAVLRAAQSELAAESAFLTQPSTAQASGSVAWTPQHLAPPCETSSSPCDAYAVAPSHQADLKVDQFTFSEQLEALTPLQQVWEEYSPLPTCLGLREVCLSLARASALFSSVPYATQDRQIHSLETASILLPLTVIQPQGQEFSDSESILQANLHSRLSR